MPVLLNWNLYFCEFTTPQVPNWYYIKTKQLMRLHAGLNFNRLLRACSIVLYLVCTCTLYIIQLPISIATVISWEGFFFIEIVLAWTKSRPNQGLLYRRTEHSADFCWKKKITGGGKKAPPNYIAEVDFWDHDIWWS